MSLENGYLGKDQKSNTISREDLGLNSEGNFGSTEQVAKSQVRGINSPSEVQVSGVASSVVVS